MNPIKSIRDRLGMTQAQLAEGMGCTQGNVGHYEKGQTVPPDAAKRLIAFALEKGVAVSYEDIYGAVPGEKPGATPSGKARKGKTKKRATPDRAKRAAKNEHPQGA